MSLFHWVRQFQVGDSTDLRLLDDVTGLVLVVHFVGVVFRFVVVAVPAAAGVATGVAVARRPPRFIATWSNRSIISLSVVLILNYIIITFSQKKRLFHYYWNRRTFAALGGRRFVAGRGRRSTAGRRTIVVLFVLLTFALFVLLLTRSRPTLPCQIFHWKLQRKERLWRQVEGTNRVRASASHETDAERDQSKLLMSVLQNGRRIGPNLT